MQTSYGAQTRVVVQLLKDWKLPYSTGPGSRTDDPPPANKTPYASQEGYSPLNKEVTKRWENTPEANSHRLVSDALSRMRRFSPFYHAIASIFLQDDAGDADYASLKEKAKKHGGKSASRRLLDDLEIALHQLTMLLSDEELYADFPNRMKTPGRRQTMEESYTEIHRVFLSWLQELGTTHKRCRRRSQAYENTAISCDVSRSTVERAVHYCEAA